MKNLKLIVLFFGLGMFFVSCEKKQNEWENFYGFTNEDVVGTYSYSNIASAFDGVEGISRYACYDADIKITASSTQSGKLVFLLNCPDENYSRTIEDLVTPNENDFMIRMSSGIIHSGAQVKAHNITAYVMKNAKNQIRLHGFAAVNTYKVVTNPESGLESYIIDDGVYYYFDVIKN